MLCKQDAACDTRAGAVLQTLLLLHQAAGPRPAGFTLLVPPPLCCSFRWRAPQPSPRMLPLIVRRAGEYKSTQLGKFRNETRDETGGPWSPPVSLSVFIARIFYAFDFMLILLLSRALPLRQKRKEKKKNPTTHRRRGLILRGLRLTQNLLLRVLLRETHQQKKKKIAK